MANNCGKSTKKANIEDEMNFELYKTTSYCQYSNRPLTFNVILCKCQKPFQQNRQFSKAKHKKITSNFHSSLNHVHFIIFGWCMFFFSTCNFLLQVVTYSITHRSGNEKQQPSSLIKWTQKKRKEKESSGKVKKSVRKWECHKKQCNTSRASLVLIKYAP